MNAFIYWCIRLFQPSSWSGSRRFASVKKRGSKRLISKRQSVGKNRPPVTQMAQLNWSQRRNDGNDGSDGSDGSDGNIGSTGKWERSDPRHRAPGNRKQTDKKSKRETRDIIRTRSLNSLQAGPAPRPRAKLQFQRRNKWKRMEKWRPAPLISIEMQLDRIRSMPFSWFPPVFVFFLLVFFRILEPSSRLISHPRPGADLNKWTNLTEGNGCDSGTFPSSIELSWIILPRMWLCSGKTSSSNNSTNKS